MGFWRCVWPLVLFGLAGCATYEYDLTQPPALAGHIGRKAWRTVDYPPLVYHFRSYENRLIMRVENPTDQPVQLLGERSYAVDPQGASHPLRSQSVAPSSFMKLVFPPPPPRIERLGPSIGIGVGTRVSADPATNHPVYLDIYEESASNLYWDWEGETPVRMLLVWQRGEESFQHEFVFQRRKAE